MSDFPKITIDISGCLFDSTKECSEMFDGMRDWFAERGYILYTFVNNEVSFPTLEADTLTMEPSDIAQSPFLYAYVGGNEFAGYPTVRQLRLLCQHRVVLAQDRRGAHVAIKLMKKGSDEYRIAQFLFEKRDITSSHCIIPVLEIKDCEDHAFMVMPRYIYSHQSVNETPSVNETNGFTTP
ncbi:hypothetical protein FISHEDRAFT_73445 [Fistulina hepatica ATCC 64428]|uniref:Uncharacterized protein n=1 Tax=Fistulina hepatica ATCC 64428 TaxID=1128425 RepID=A0A0D7ADZ0_9AGAR|nr:hypothetical protein FISHEDRAFT_73445 [Fistulina hepatica ATCC 64428]